MVFGRLLLPADFDRSLADFKHFPGWNRRKTHIRLAAPAFRWPDRAHGVGTAFALTMTRPMVYWAPIPHFYQPPTQFPAVLKRICDESYRPLIAPLGECERVQATVNINGSLTQMLLDCGHHDVVARLRQIAANRRIEFSGRC